jgi:hypothetical protein
MTTEARAPVIDQFPHCEARILHAGECTYCDARPTFVLSRYHRLTDGRRGESENSRSDTAGRVIGWADHQGAWRAVSRVSPGEEVLSCRQSPAAWPRRPG